MSAAPTRVKVRRYLASPASAPVLRARKIGGTYEATGTIVSEFTTLAGHRRVVFEFDEPAGMLHIFNRDQIEFIGEKA